MNYRTSLVSLALIIVVCVLLSAARPLLCWKIGRDLTWKRAYCTSTEFDALAPNEQPAPATATPIVYATETPVPLPTATETWEWKPTATWSYPYPLPTMPTLEPYPYMLVNP